MPETVSFTAADGWSLVGDVFRGDAPRVAVLISAGTGFPRRFYRHLAAHLAAKGAVVLTYDYRGIGDSKGGDLRGSEIAYPDWGRFDMAAAVDRLATLAPGLPIVHLGHSAGGQFAGFLPNHDKVARHAFLSVGSGFWGVHHLRRIPLELFFWWGFGSWHLMRHGFVRSGKLWRGEDLPPDVFRIWRRWSQRRSYLLPDLQAGRWSHHFDQLAAPICAWVFPDDGIATPKAARDTLSGYSAAPKHLVERAPADIGRRHIGHDGAFRRGCEPLWDECWDWLADGVLPKDAQTA